MKNSKNRNYSSGYDLVRKKVLRRDRYRCQFPGCGSRTDLELHHIFPYSTSIFLREEPDNIICLCHLCHKKVTGVEHNYQKLFIDIVNENNNRQQRKKSS